MPISTNLGDSLIQEKMLAIAPRRVLDIGCGAGKYGKMLKGMDEAIVVEGIEVHAPYIQEFSLDSIYDKIHAIDSIEFFNVSANLDASWDLIILGDVLEHMHKSDGVDLLSKLVYVSRYIIVAYPPVGRQGALEGVESERHISAWSEWDFKGFSYEHFICRRKHMRKNVVVIKGAIETPKKKRKRRRKKRKRKQKPNRKPIIDDIRRIQGKYSGYGDIRCFVETGLLFGDTIISLADHFDRLYGIELDEANYKYVSRRVQKQRKGNVNLYWGDSAFVIEHLAQKIGEATIFYLDAHYCKARTSPDGFAAFASKLNFPLFEELKAISRRKYGDIIAIDDYAMFGNYYEEFIDWRTVTCDNIMSIFDDRIVVDAFGDKNIFYILLQEEKAEEERKKDLTLDGILV